MKSRPIILVLAAAFVMSGCALDQPLAANDKNPAAPAEGPQTNKVQRANQTIDLLPQLTEPVF